MEQPIVGQTARMILRHSDDWQQILKASVRTTQQLLDILDLSPTATDPDPSFPVRVPTPYLARIKPSDRSDPLLRQVLPLLKERQSAPSFVPDPLAEQAATRMPGLLQKYAHRALLIASPACAIHCRYCFRREFPYEQHRGAALEQAVGSVLDDTNIHEVILSGGDPLSLTDNALSALLQTLAAAPHIRRLRVHARLPVVIPQRVTDQLAKTICDIDKPIVWVSHINHAQELDEGTARAFATLADNGATLLNQAVLLAGVNDSADAQIALAEACFAQGILPYYLHMPDRVAGTQHFEVQTPHAQEIIAQMHAQLPGYLIPRLVREVPGRAGKSPINWTERDALSL